LIESSDGYENENYAIHLILLPIAQDIKEIMFFLFDKYGYYILVLSVVQFYTGLKYPIEITLWAGYSLTSHFKIGITRALFDLEGDILGKDLC
jgi:hypothetical protein